MSNRPFLCVTAMMLALAIFPQALAATVEQGAIAAAQAWAKAIIARDVDAEMQLLPKTLYAKPGERDQQRLGKLRDKERAFATGEKILSLDVLAPIQTVTIGNTVAVVLPYRMERTSAGSKLQIDSSVIALSDDGGATWSALDGSGQSTRSLKIVIPGYAGNLALPRTASKIVKSE